MSDFMTPPKHANCRAKNMTLRPFLSDDAATILSWCKDKHAFRLWSADRYKEDKTVTRFGFVIVDDSKRGKGYGKQMLRLAIDYAKRELGAQRITLGVFDNNPLAIHCYESVGFVVTGTDTYAIDGEEWTGKEMELVKKTIYKMMKEMKFCQSCGMPLTEDVLGTNADGSKNEDFCMYCYKDDFYPRSFVIE